MNMYSTRKSAFQKDVFWEINNLEIIRTTDGVQNRIPFKKISSIRFFYHPARYRTNQYMCEIKGDNIKYKISSVSYESFANFKSKATDYNFFIEELYKEVKKGNPKCVFRIGNSVVIYFTHIIITLFVLVVLYFALSFLGGIIFIKLIVLGFYLIYTIKSLVINKPKIITSNELPKSVLAKT